MGGHFAATHEPPGIEGVMVKIDILTQLQQFREIIKPHESLAPYTLLKIGGPAEAVIEPRSLAELAAAVKVCLDKQIPFHVLGTGSNILVRDEGIQAAIFRLSAPAFTQVTVQGGRVRAGGGATLASLISVAAQNNLAGLETLVGMPGTVGGSLRRSYGDRSEEFAQYLRRVDVIDSTGTPQTRERDDPRQAYNSAILDDPVVVAVELELERDAADAIVKRLRKAWIQRKASQPFSYQAAGLIFKNPRGLNAAALIEQAGLVGTRVGGAQVSDRHASCFIADAGTTAKEVLRLIDLIRSRVQERFHIELELEISVW
jgi:UDP-N-acetylmuramate dehydrogenase